MWQGVQVKEKAKMNHEKICMSAGVERKRRECARCGNWITKENYARHVRRCRGKSGGGGSDAEAGEKRGGEVEGCVKEGGRAGGAGECHFCAKILIHTYMVRYH